MVTLKKGENTLFLSKPASPTATFRASTGGADFLGGKLKQLRANNTNMLLISGGGAIDGSSPASVFFCDESAIEVMNLVKVYNNVVGNH